MKAKTIFLLILLSILLFLTSCSVILPEYRDWNNYFDSCDTLGDSDNDICTVYSFSPILDIDGKYEYNFFVKNTKLLPQFVSADIFHEYGYRFDRFIAFAGNYGDYRYYIYYFNNNALEVRHGKICEWDKEPRLEIEKEGDMTSLDEQLSGAIVRGNIQYIYNEGSLKTVKMLFGNTEIELYRAGNDQLSLLLSNTETADEAYDHIAALISDTPYIIPDNSQVYIVIAIAIFLALAGMTILILHKRKHKTVI